MKNKQPTLRDIFMSTVYACHGEIYPSIRLICFKMDFKTKSYTLRVYLDRPPTDNDFNAARYIGGYVLDGYWGYFSDVKEECIYSKESRNTFDKLDHVVYARREYNLDEVL